MSDYQYEVTSLPVDETLFYRRDDMVQRLRVLVRYAQLAPSTYNSQPWQFSVQSPDQVWVFADPDRWLKIADADKREMHLSLGCAIENLLIAAAHYNYKYKVEYVPDRLQLNLMAIIHLTPGISEVIKSPDAALMQAMLDRFTARCKLSKEPLQASHWALLESCFLEDVKVISSRHHPRLREKAADLTPLAYQVLYDDRAYREEHYGRLALSNTRLQSIGIRFRSLCQRLLGRGGDYYGTRDQRWIMEAPGLMLIGAEEDSVASRLKCGRVMQRLSLLATTLGVGLQPMSQVLEIPELRDELKKAVSFREKFEPMMLCRLGYHKNRRNGRSLRRQLADVLI